MALSNSTLGLSYLRRTVLCLLHRHGSSTQSGVLLHLQDLDGTPGHSVPRRWIECHWRHLQARMSHMFFLIPSLLFMYRVPLTKPQTERGAALGWFLSGTLIGPALGPFIGGIIVTFGSWRNIFWLQTALAGTATLLTYFLLPETIHYKRSEELQGLDRKKKLGMMWIWLNPLRVIKLYRYPNLLTVSIASSSLVWNMYSLLTPIRYVLNPRFHLTTPLQSGLIYIAPGAGYLVGTFVGGRYADHIVKKWIRIRGERVAEDRLRSCTLFLGGVIPACMLVYGWSIEKGKGGLALPIVMMFLQGVAQLFCFPSLNTYCLDVMQSRSSEVVGEFSHFITSHLISPHPLYLCEEDL
jgi:MFS family permease